MQSIIQHDRDRCYICGRNGVGDPLECHHVFGAANRDHSEEDGMKVYLCGSRCHRAGLNSVHQNRKVADKLKAEAQKVWEATYGSREDFRNRYGKSYL